MSALISNDDVHLLDDEERYVALHYAASNGLLPDLRLLLTSGVDYDAQDQVCN